MQRKRDSSPLYQDNVAILLGPLPGPIFAHLVSFNFGKRSPVLSQIVGVYNIVFQMCVQDFNNKASYQEIVNSRK